MLTVNTEYRILETDNRMALQVEVQGHLNKGFELVGPLVIVWNPDEAKFIYAQSILKTQKFG